MWKPNFQQMTTPIKLQSRIETDVNGMPEISYQDKSNAAAFCNWKGRGGTETTQSGSLVVEDTAEVVMWYRPDVTARDIVLLNHQTAYEIVSPPENVEMRNQYLMFKVRRFVNG
jgi:SPP1 family predicted phage head-tail adaptor